VVGPSVDDTRRVDVIEQTGHVVVIYCLTNRISPGLLPEGLERHPPEPHGADAPHAAFTTRQTVRAGSAIQARPATAGPLRSTPGARRRIDRVASGDPRSIESGFLGDRSVQ